jgi:DNA-directed RNA polymerase subunit RPC12/RpoP
VWIISGVAILFLLNIIDTIVNQELYDFGLQLSADWLLPYWTYMRLTLALIGVSLVLSFLALVFGLSRRKRKLQENLPNPHRQGNTIQRNVLRKSDGNLSQNNDCLLISCSSCGKEFSRPMVSLSFEKGDNTLVTVCPYCNHVLGDRDSQSQKLTTTK